MHYKDASTFTTLQAPEPRDIIWHDFITFVVCLVPIFITMYLFIVMFFLYN